MFRWRRHRRDALPRHPRVLVVHVQRTGGTSLRQMLEATTRRNDVFPTTTRLHEQHDDLYIPPRDLIAGWESIPAHRFLFGHVLASLGEVLPVPYATAAFLREPVARSISIVQLHAKRSGRTISDLVDDPDFMTTHITDMQTRVFGLGPEFATLAPRESPLADDDALDQAIARLRAFEFIGITEAYTDSLRRFDHTFGTSLATVGRHVNSSHVGDVAHAELVERFTPLVSRDRELYAVARAERPHPPRP